MSLLDGYLKIKNSRIKSQIDRLEAESSQDTNSRIKSQINNLEAKSSQNANLQAELQDTNSRIKAQIDRLEAKSSQNINSQSELQETNSRIKAQIDNLEAESSQSELQAKNFQKENLQDNNSQKKEPSIQEISKNLAIENEHLKNTVEDVVIKAQDIVYTYETLIYRLQGIINATNSDIYSDVKIACNEIVDSYFLKTESQKRAINMVNFKLKEKIKENPTIQDILKSIDF